MEKKEKNYNEDLKNIKEEVSGIANSDKETINAEKRKPQKSTSSNKEIEKLRTENQELKDLLLRTKADFENYRKRMMKELEEIRDKAKISFVLDILPVIDNFELSLKMTDNKEAFIKGVEMIHQNLCRILKENHFEEFIPKEGEEFNPELHDPLLVESDKHKSGTIIGVIQKGYLHKKLGSVIRPAKVKVAKTIEKKKEEEQKRDLNNSNS